MPEDLSSFNLLGISTADKQTKTISSGDITPTEKFVIVAAQAGTTDGLDGIVTTGIDAPGDADGAELWLMADSGDTITIRHNQNAAATKNILTASGSALAMSGNMLVRVVYNIALDTNGAWVVEDAVGSLYLLATGGRAGSTSQAQDFGSTGIKADAIAESTPAAGVTIDSVLLKDGFVGMAEISTPSTPSANNLRIFPRANGSNIELIALSSTGAECVICTLANGAAPANILTLNWIE